MNSAINEQAAAAKYPIDAGRETHGIGQAITRAAASLLALQHTDGHWVFELEADATIPSEYILLQHYLGRSEPELQTKIAWFVRAQQGEDGGWPLFHGGALDVSCSVKAYFALKAAGDPIDAPHMARARTAILAQGGARRCNVFTRIMLALVRRGAVAGGSGHAGRNHAVARMVAVSHRQGRLLVAHRSGAAAGADGAAAPRPQPARHHDSRVVRRTARSQCATGSPGRPHRRWRWFSGCSTGCCVRPSRGFRRGRVDAQSPRRSPLSTERLNGEDGLGGIFPAMANSLMMFDCLGYPPRSSRLADRRMPRSTSLSSSMASAVIANPACRRSGTRR